MNIPKDPMMLLSFINMKLRDNYSDLEALCEDFDVNPEEIKSKLEAIGFQYDQKANAFR